MTLSMKFRATFPRLACAALALAVWSCGPEVQTEDEPTSTGSEDTQQVTLDAALAAGCDSDLFLEATEAFLRADREATAKDERGSMGYNRAMDASGAPRLDRVFRSAYDLHRNEMHDCQRLILVDEHGARSLGPLTAIFVDSGAVASSPRSGVVAEIYNFTGERYAPLGLFDGMHCLWMEWDGTQWQQSWIFKPPANPNGPDCAGISSPPSNPTATLRTTQRIWQGASLRLEDYPTTGRWMWHEAQQGAQYIGIRCANAWCELTPAGVPPNPADFAVKDSVPGWFDRQILSYKTTQAGTSTLVLSSTLHGTISPGPGVRYRSYHAQRTALSTGPQAVAVITLVGDDKNARSAYGRKLNVRTQATGSPPVSVDSLFMRVIAAGGPERWQAWTGSAPGDTKDLEPLVDVRHSGLGTVRWRWVEDDEGGWIPCRDGCCYWQD